ncbi:T9SS type A sorting domain-containing protein [Phaeocystidibacter marisrubri]|uniref:T9SS type A sorting domain-containing protein n=1 Tax=Phaeocystidibacter marisrubri TaxID=1577780 RepID=A0A6L3ZDA3_9FLAO|nr:T9SS type A sorting domain-containing protein [Phaeocystidibacter marisrubri]KAB2815528.1 T9SS type A sorting domain-containing protein [Phaeocystidibacter marisrubri]GGH64362.1 hypothetical protein GCM10011318_00310 [Phaeocystidibacter marisrubri]
MKSIVIAVLGLFSLSVNGQLPYTNVANHIAHNSDASIEVVGDYYYVANITNNVSPLSFQYARLDTNGLVLDTLTLEYDPSYYFNTNCIKCFTYHQGSFYHAINNGFNHIPGNDTSEILLHKVANDLSDTIVSTVYSTSLRNSLFATDIVFDSDSTFIMSSLHGYYNGTDPQQPGYWKIGSVISRLDTNFNLIWETEIPDIDMNRNNGLSPSQIVIDNNGGIFVVGPDHIYSTSSLNEAFVAKISQADGHLYWRKHFTRTRGIDGMYLTSNYDGTFTFVQNFSINPTQWNPILNVGILDSNGVVLNEREFNWGSTPIIAEGLIRLQDGSYYVSGVYDVAYGLGFRFTPQLDSLWSTSYEYPFTAGLSNVDDFQQDSSGMLVHTGWTVTSDIDNWLFRIDLQGCDSVNCGLNITEESNLQAFSVYPNPSKQDFHLEIAEDFVNARVSFELTDIYGRIVLKNVINQSPMKLSIEKAGVYFITIRNEHLSVLHTEKLIIIE